MLTLNWIFFVCIGGVLLLFALMCCYYDWQNNKFYQRGRSRFLFYCIKCGNVYSGAKDDKESDCPGCGYRNLKLRF